MRISTIAALAGAVLMLAPAAQAQVRVNMKVGRPENFNRVDPHKMGMNKQDRTYMQNAYYANAFEARLGAMAMNRAGDSWVRDFGQDMNREHTMANEELKQLARKEGVYLSNNMPRMYTMNLNKMANLRGASFDNAFRKINKMGHMMVMDASAKEIKSGRDAMARSYATKMLATARAHENLVLTHQTMIVRNGPGTYGSAAQEIKP